jgi:hypothetical protein
MRYDMKMTLSGIDEPAMLNEIGPDEGADVTWMVMATHIISIYIRQRPIY